MADSGTILVAEDDADLRRFVEVNLRLNGFEVIEVSDGEAALSAALLQAPDLVVLDIGLPGLDGLEVTRRLRAGSRTAQLPVILLTARTLPAERAAGLMAGADDYVLKPFDTTELIARVRTVLRRGRELRAASPLTGLPGNHAIESTLAARVEAGVPVAVVHADLNGFKSFNDRYGFLRGDAVILLTAGLLQRAIAVHAAGEGFLGHVGGDDFVAVVPPDAVAGMCAEVVDRFDAAVPQHYEPADRERGYLVMPDRRGNTHRHPLVSIALGAATNTGRVVTDHRELVAAATEMKSFCKSRLTGSCWAVDGRAGHPPATAIA